MNVYDFDGTIYAGDSSVQFWLFCLYHRPWLLVWLPWQLCGILLYKLGLHSKTKMKEYFFSFLQGVPNIETQVHDFWEKYASGVEAWYLHQQEAEDVIISASPDFLLRPLCVQLGIRHLIASQVNPKDGRFEGENCYGSEKVCRFLALFPDADISSFYSDSFSDTPMAKIAECAYLRKQKANTFWPNLN